MDETNFVLLWKEQNEKIDQSLAINKQLLKEALNKKVQKALDSLTRLKSFGIIAAVIYLILLGIVLFYAIANYSSASNYFIVSTGAIFLINLKALYDYIKHLAWIDNINYDANIVETQQRLVRLQLSIIRHTRFMFLQLPFWTTFYISNKWFPYDVSWSYIIFQFLFTGLFTYLAYWLYKNITLQNVDKKWVRILINGSGGKYVMDAIKFNNELDKFRQD
jgi:uncharacterized membrane protein